MNKIISKLRQELKQSADEHTKKIAQNFFKEKIMVYGVKTAAVTKIGKKIFQEIKDEPKPIIFQLCTELWQSGFLEESGIACNWSYLVHKDYEPKDLQVFIGWLKKYVSNWAACDTLCNHTIGEFLEMYPGSIKELKKLAVAKNRWLKRAAAVSLIIPARKGKFLKDIFEIAEILLLDQDDLVQKGYGWMLKAASEAHQKEVFDFVMCKKAVMPRTALRYAIEKMPPVLRKKAMAV